MTEHVNLTGRWAGVYFYPLHPELNPEDSLPATPFSAEMKDSVGRISGTTIEPDTLGPKGSPEIPAVLEGYHQGGILTFSKFPEGGGHDDPITYTGQISEDGNVIQGDWIIVADWDGTPFTWAGTFRMQRRSATHQASQDVLASIST